jgi:hypothetical protein
MVMGSVCQNFKNYLTFLRKNKSGVLKSKDRLLGELRLGLGFMLGFKLGFK